MEKTSLDLEEVSPGLARQASGSRVGPSPGFLGLQLFLGPPHEIELLSPPETCKEPRLGKGGFLSRIFGYMCE